MNENEKFLLGEIAKLKSQTKLSKIVRGMEMKITKVTKAYFETEGERVYFFEPLDEEMTVSELQELRLEILIKFLKQPLGKVEKLKEEGSNADKI